jgi:5-formyltetrahydrofolate cyclo-ligase
MPAKRDIRKLSEEELEMVQKLYRQTENADIRSHCQMILLSNQGHRVAEIAQMTFFDEDTVLYWFDRYEAENLKGLEDRPHSGHPPKSKWRM